MFNLGVWAVREIAGIGNQATESQLHYETWDLYMFDVTHCAAWPVKPRPEDTGTYTAAAMTFGQPPTADIRFRTHVDDANMNGTRPECNSACDLALGLGQGCRGQISAAGGTSQAYNIMSPLAQT